MTRQRRLPLACLFSITCRRLWPIWPALLLIACRPLDVREPTAVPVVLSTTATLIGPTPTAVVLALRPTPVAQMPTCEHPYYPLRQGATWTYLITGTLLPDEQRQVVTELINTGGTTAVTIQTIGITATQALCTSTGLFFQAYPTFTGVVNHAIAETTHAEGAFLPPEGQLTPGAMWHTYYNLRSPLTRVIDGVAQTVVLTTSIRLTFEVIDTERVTTPAGVFDTLKINLHTTAHLSLSHQPEIDYDQVLWFARGVGLVKSTFLNTGRTIELTQYHVP